MIHISDGNKAKILGKTTQIERLISSRDVISIQDLFLEKVIELLELAKESYMGKKTEIEGEYGLSVLKRYENMYFGETEIKDVDDLLDIYLDAIEKKIDINLTKLNFSIYPALSIKNVDKGDGEFKEKTEKTEKTEKYRKFLNIMLSTGVNIDNLVVYEEELDKTRMRQYPYKIIYISEGEMEKTILISDEIGQATFVYDGIINIDKFKNYKKGEKIEGLFGKQVVYGKNYSDRLKDAIYIENEESLISDFKISSHKNIAGEFSLKDILEWQQFIESKKEILEKKSNIFCEDGIWYFGEAKCIDTWKELRCFPNARFNKDNNIGDERGSIRKSSDLKTMFGKIGLIIATEQEEIVRWGRQLEGYESKLSEEANIYKEDGIWYFGEAKGVSSWIFLQYYPNKKFNTKYDICNFSGSISSLEKFKLMFEKLGLKVATDQEEVVRWKTKLSEESNIYLEDGIWYFGDAKGCTTWSYLQSFPSVGLLKKWKIGSSKGVINNSTDLKKMFRKIGLKIASKKQQKQRWGKIIESKVEKLSEEARIYNRDGTWYFWYSKGIRFWSEFKSFPNLEFNRINAIGNVNGNITNPIELKKMFKSLGLKVATDKQEITGLGLILASYKDRLAEESNIFEKDGIWYFGEAKGNKTWSSYLQNFPNTTFNRENGLGDKNGAIISLHELKRVFKFLGLKISLDKLKN